MIVYVNRLKSDGSGRMPFELAEDIIAMDHGGKGWTLAALCK